MHLTDEDRVLRSLISFVRNLLEARLNAQESFREYWHNEAYALGTGLKLVARIVRARREKVLDLDIHETVYQAIQKFSWSETVLENLLGFARLW